MTILLLYLGETSLPARGRDVAQVALVFVAHVFEQVAVGIQTKVFRDGPGACVGDGVFDGDVDEQMTEVGTAEPLGDDERFRVRVAVVVEPGLIIESGGSDYQDVAFPLSGRVTQPRRWSIGLQRASVHIDLPEHGLDFIQDHDHFSRLDNAAWRGASSPVTWDAVRQTIILGIVAAEGFGALVVESLAPRSHRDVFHLEVGGEVPIVFEVRKPHAG